MKRLMTILFLILCLCGCENNIDRNYLCTSTLEDIKIEYEISSKENKVNQIMIHFIINDQDLDFDFTSIDELHKTNIVNETTNNINTFLNYENVTLTHEFKEHTLTFNLNLSLEKDLILIQELFSKEITSETSINAFIKALESNNHQCDLN